MKKEIAQGLLSIEAVFLRPEEPFTWASGIKSPIYCDNRLTLTAPEVRTKVENGLVQDVYKRQGVEHRKGGFQTDDAEGAAGKSLCLFFRAVRSVIRGDHIDGTVFYPFDQRVAVFCAAEGRIHLKASILLQVVFAENQVMGSGFPADVGASFFGLSQNFYRFFCGDVADVVSGAGLFRQFRISLHLYPLAFGADSPVTVRSGVSAVVNVTAVEQTFVLSLIHISLVVPLKEMEPSILIS